VRVRALACLLLLLPAWASAAPDPVEILKRTANIAIKPPYTATRTIISGSQTVTIKLYWSGPQSERQQLPGGQGQLLYIENDRQAWYTGAALAGGPSHSYGLAEMLSIPLVVRNYRIRLVGSNPVAGRPACCLQLSPLVADRSSWRLWVDQATGLVLRRESTSPEGKVQFVEYLSDLKFNPPLSRALFVPPAKTGAPRQVLSLPVPDLEKRLGCRIALPRRLPAGFVLIDSRLVQVAQDTFAHLYFSDGLNGLSLFELPARADRAGQQRTRTAWLVSGLLADALTWSSSGMHLTLVGALPETLLREIAASVR